jgi:hypothetical protein
MEFCDYTIVLDAGSDDGTLERLHYYSDSPNLKIISTEPSEWRNKVGKEKLSYFQNITIQEADRMGFQYVFLLQADECVTPSSYNAIRKAVNDQKEGYICKRVNLWGRDCYHALKVEESRQPCSTQVVRLAKTNYRSYDDGENLGVDKLSTDYLNEITIFHYGFVRDRKIMKQKVINMQEQIFNIDHDKKLDGADEFIPERWFSGDDLELINEPHPEIMKDWVAVRP